LRDISSYGFWAAVPLETAIPNSKLLEAGMLDISFTSNLFEEP
jgi:hypothetical protein